MGSAPNASTFSSVLCINSQKALQSSVSYLGIHQSKLPSEVISEDFNKKRLLILGVVLQIISLLI